MSNIALSDPLMDAWLLALGNAIASPSSSVANLVVCGDSITEGWASEFAYARWVDILATRLAAACGHDPADGYVPCASVNGTGTVTHGYKEKAWSLVTGTVTLRTDLGLGYRAANLATGGTKLSYTTVNDCDRIWVFYPTYTSAVGSISISVDGGAPTVINEYTPGTPTQGSNVWDSGALSAGPHTITVTQSGLASVVEGAYFFNGNYSGGVRVWEGGHYGYQSAKYAASGTGDWWTAGFASIQPDAVLVALQTNDQIATSPAISPSAHQANMVAIANQIYAAIPGGAQTPVPSVLFVAGMGFGSSLYSSYRYRQATYWAARDTGISTPAAVLDFETIAGYVGTATGGDPYFVTSDNKHPSTKGHLLLGNYLADHMLAASAVPAASAYGQSVEPFGPGVAYTAFGEETTGSASIGTANYAVYLRARGGGVMKAINVRVGTSSGNISVATLDGTVGPQPPLVRTQTSGSIACPAAGYARIPFSDVNFVSVVRPTDGWFAISADNTTATFDVAGGSSSTSSNYIGVGTSYYQSSAHPIPATPAPTNPWRYGRFILIGNPFNL